QKSLDALSWVAHLSAGEAIATVAASDPNINHRRAALEALRRKIHAEWRPIVDQPIFAELFEKSLTDAASVSQMLALVSAAGAKAYVPRIIDLIDRPDTDKSLRRAAVEALGQIRTKESMAKLAAILKSV